MSQYGGSGPNLSQHGGSGHYLSQFDDSGHNLSQNGGSGQNVPKYGGSCQNLSKHGGSGQIMSQNDGSGQNVSLHERSVQNLSQNWGSGQNLSQQGGLGQSVPHYVVSDQNLSQDGGPGQNGTGSIGGLQPNVAQLDGSIQGGIQQTCYNYIHSGQNMSQFGIAEPSNSGGIGQHMIAEGAAGLNINNLGGLDQNFFQNEGPLQDYSQIRNIPQHLHQVGGPAIHQQALGVQNHNYYGQKVSPYTYVNNSMLQASTQAMSELGINQMNVGQLNQSTSEQVFPSNLVYIAHDSNPSSEITQCYNIGGNLQADSNHLNPNLVYRVNRQSTSPAKQPLEATKPCAIISPQLLDHSELNRSSPAKSPDLGKLKASSTSREATCSPDTRDVGTSCDLNVEESRPIPFVVETCQICNLFSNGAEHTCQPPSYYSYSPCLYGNKVVEVNEDTQIVAANKDQNTNNSQALRIKR